MTADSGQIPTDAVRAVEQRLAAAIGSGLGVQSRVKHFTDDDARATLLALRDRFDAAGVRFFLDRGTLLGAVRDGGFIAGDYDIDLGVFSDELQAVEVVNLAEAIGFTVNQRFEFKIGAVSPWGIQVDFFFTDRTRGYFKSRGYRGIHEWYFSPFGLAEFDLLGERFLVPDPLERHLAENYGNWRSRVAFYDLSFDEPCVLYGRHAHSIDYLTARLEAGLESGSRHLAVSAARALHDEFGVAEVAPVLEEDRWPRSVGASAPLVVVADRFDRLQPELARSICDALSRSPNVELWVLTGGDDTGHGASEDERASLAAAIDGVRAVRLIDAARLGEEADRSGVATLLAAPTAPNGRSTG